MCIKLCPQMRTRAPRPSTAIVLQHFHKFSVLFCPINSVPFCLVTEFLPRRYRSHTRALNVFHLHVEQREKALVLKFNYIQKSSSEFDAEFKTAKIIKPLQSSTQKITAGVFLKNTFHNPVTLKRTPGTKGTCLEQRYERQGYSRRHCSCHCLTLQEIIVFSKQKSSSVVHRVSFHFT